MQEIEKIWSEAVNQFKKERPREYRIWLSMLKPLQLDGTTITVGVPNKFTWDWFSDNQLPYFSSIIEKTNGIKPKFKIEILNNVKSSEQEPSSQIPDPSNSQLLNPKLNPKYSFSRFIVGKSNEFAHNASLEVAKGTSKRYNPLFIHGGTGLGKTHLLHAIGHAVYSLKAGKEITYITSEQFLNEYVSATKSQRMNEFREKFRKNSEILLVDDIQFINKGHKDMTQEEFFYTFNYLYDSNKQIIITSDKCPAELQGLEDRLKSRFAWGLIVEIKPPSFEERVAILKDKATIEGVILSDDVCSYIAESFHSNIRELEGALNQVIALASLTNSKICLDVVQEALSSIVKVKTPVTTEEIIRVTAGYFNVKPNDVKSHKRHREFTEPRQVAMFLCRKIIKMSYPDIGDHFGGKDHSTVISSVKKVEKDLERNPSLRERIESIENRLLK